MTREEQKRLHAYPFLVKAMRDLLWVNSHLHEQLKKEHFDAIGSAAELMFMLGEHALSEKE